LAIDHAHGLMRRADRLAAARALRHLVRAHRLVGAALTILEARRTETPASLRRIRDALLGVPVAHDPAAAAARREARRAGGVPVLGADPFVGRAMLQAARRTDALVLVAGRLLVHATLCDTVVGVEVLGPGAGGPQPRPAPRRRVAPRAAPPPFPGDGAKGRAASPPAPGPRPLTLCPRRPDPRAPPGSLPGPGTRRPDHHPVWRRSLGRTRRFRPRLPRHPPRRAARRARRAAPPDAQPAYPCSI